MDGMGKHGRYQPPFNRNGTGEAPAVDLKSG